jgi:hypothetical protein
MHNFDHNIFLEKRQFFSPKIVKNRRKCDRNIDPRSPWFQAKITIMPFRFFLPVETADVDSVAVEAARC